VRPDFFWLHIKKAGGQSLRELLKGVYVETNRSVPTPFVALPKEEWNDGLNNFRLPLGEYTFKRTLFARRFLYSRDEFEGMYKFAVVRNPYERIVSSYLYTTKNSKKWRAYRLLGQKRAFLEFLKQLPEKWSAPNKGRNRHVATHTAPIIPDISDEHGTVLLDKLYHLEKLNVEIEELAAALDLQVRDIPHRNKGRDSSEYRRYYSKEGRREVENLYSQDIELLGYEF